MKDSHYQRGLEAAPRPQRHWLRSTPLRSPQRLGRRRRLRCTNWASERVPGGRVHDADADLAELRGIVNTRSGEPAFRSQRPTAPGFRKRNPSTAQTRPTGAPPCERPMSKCGQGRSILRTGYPNSRHLPQQSAANGGPHALSSPASNTTARRWRIPDRMNTPVPLVRSGLLHVTIWTLALMAVVLSSRGLPVGSPAKQVTSIAALLICLGLGVTSVAAFFGWLRRKRR